MKLAILLLMAAPAFAAQPLAGFPFTDEALAYNVTWPSGLSLGEVHLTAKSASTGWNFTATGDVAVPGFQVKDTYKSSSSADFCSSEFSRDFVHGSKKGGEKETIDRAAGTATRQTVNGGGKSQFPVPDCTRDALTMVYYARRELGQGRVPPAQQILLGSLYSLQLDYAGARTIQSGGKATETDEMICTYRGATSTVKLEIYFARDPARTPLLVSIPLSVGKVSMELVR